MGKASSSVGMAGEHSRRRSRLSGAAPASGSGSGLGPGTRTRPGPGPGRPLRHVATENANNGTVTAARIRKPGRPVHLTIRKSSLSSVRLRSASPSKQRQASSYYLPAYYLFSSLRDALAQLWGLLSFKKGISSNDRVLGAAMTFICYLAWTLLVLQNDPLASALPLHVDGSDLSIVQHNDLYGASSPRGNAVILASTPHTYADAVDVCKNLGEQLWTPPLNDSVVANVVGSFESREVGSYHALYWIQSTEDCVAINTKGQIEDAPCDSALPAICSQSAPLSSLSSIDTSKRWQTSVVSGRQTITGFRDKLSFRFHGIRYASKPDRFTYSSVHEETGNVSALTFGPTCVQTGCLLGACSEDCLFLNIWTPYLPRSQASRAPLKPVMFWIHGGAFVSGYGSDPTFDGGNMASRGDVVVVTINYRLGAFGFLALNDGKTNGNYGIADQITALDWVREHIKDFGGDPESITIFGQSAGAASVRALLGSPKAIGKFKNAIPMSGLAGLGYASTYGNYLTISEEVELAAKPLLNATACAGAMDELACLRSYDVGKLAALSSTARYVVIDGAYVTTSQLDVAGNGPIASVPVLMGIMHDDGGPFTAYPKNGSLSASLESAFPGYSTSILNSNEFPQSAGSNATLDVFNVTSRVTTDAEFRCLDQAAAYAAVKSKTFSKVYYYEFLRSYQLSTWNPNPGTCTPPKTPSRPYGDPDLPYFKCHSGELYYTFGSLTFNELPPRDEYDIPFSQYIVDSWTAFARTSDPNPDLEWAGRRGYTNTTKLVQSRRHWWDRLNADKPKLKELDLGTGRIGGMVEFKELAQCDVLGLGLQFYL